MPVLHLANIITIQVQASLVSWLGDELGDELGDGSFLAKSLLSSARASFSISVDTRLGLESGSVSLDTCQCVPSSWTSFSEKGKKMSLEIQRGPVDSEAPGCLLEGARL